MDKDEASEDVTVTLDDEDVTETLDDEDVREAPAEEGAPADGASGDSAGDADDDGDGSGPDARPGAGAPHAALPTAAWVVMVVVALAVGVAAGHFLLGGVGRVSLDGRTTLSSSELDSTIATYTFDGTTTNVTAREVMEDVSGGTLTANADGTYDVPSASSVVTHVQNKLIIEDARSRGITVSDDEIAQFASDNFGTDDLSQLAETYGIEESSVRSQIEQSLLVSKLQDEVCDTDLPEMPSEPTQPADGEEDTPTADYASYVIALLGDEWDSDADAWARTDGPYYAALADYDISNEGATYEAATAAYSVALSAYQSAYSQVASEYGAYTDALLSRATIQLGSLAA